MNAGAAGIVEADDRRADPHRLVHNLADLLGMGLRQGTAEDREILAKHKHQPAVDGAIAGDHPVTWHLLVLYAEIHRAVLDEHIPFLERPGVQQEFKALARGQLALGVLCFDPAFPATGPRRRSFFLQAPKNLLHLLSSWLRPISSGLG